MSGVDQDGVDGVAGGPGQAVASSRPSDLAWPMIGSKRLFGATRV